MHDSTWRKLASVPAAGRLVTAYGSCSHEVRFELSLSQCLESNLAFSVPYAMRLRQCLVDYLQPTTTSRKQLYNALKYATSFPVIFLSAAQRGLLAPSTNEVDSGEEHPLFRLWCGILMLSM